MEQSIFIAMCQVNIAIGFVYIGLREFRYRNILKDKAWSAFKNVGCDSMPHEGEVHTALMKDDPEFSKNFHYIMKCASMHLVDRLPEHLVASLSSRSDGRNALSKLFSWYNNRTDKVMVFVTAILVPILMLWIESRAVGTDVRLSAEILSVGQILVVVQVSVVWVVASWVGRRIRKRGGIPGDSSTSERRRLPSRGDSSRCTGAKPPMSGGRTNR